MDVNTLQDGLQASGQASSDPERRVRWRADDESGRHRKTRSGELSKVGAFAAGIRNFSGGDLAKESDGDDLR